MSNEAGNNPQALTVIGQSDIQKGGLGFGKSKLFRLQPANLQLVQRMSRGEGATAGKIRVKESGEQFDRMQLVLLTEPEERRSLFEGEDFSPENQTCFSLDGVAPHAKAKDPKAMYCSGCKFGSWDRYEQTKDRKDIPPCKPYWHSVVIDRLTKMPYYLDVRGTSIKPFKAAMQNIARLYALMQSEGKNPNIFDISFNIYTVAQDRGTYYTYGFSDFAPVAEKDKAAFGNLYLDFVNRSRGKSAEDLQEEAEKEVAKEASALDTLLVTPTKGDDDVVDGEYVTV